MKLLAALKREEQKLNKKVQQLEDLLKAVRDARAAVNGKQNAPKRNVSAAARRRMSLAAKRRWAKTR